MIKECAIRQRFGVCLTCAVGRWFDAYLRWALFTRRWP